MMTATDSDAPERTMMTMRDGSVKEVDTSYRPAPVRLRALADIDPGAPDHVKRQAALAVFGSDTIVLDPGAPGQMGLITVAWDLVREGKAVVVGARPGWMPKVTVRLRALGPCTAPGHRQYNRADVFDLEFVSKAEREVVLWGVSAGTWDVVGEPPDSWPKGHIRSTNGGRSVAPTDANNWASVPRSQGGPAPENAAFAPQKSPGWNGNSAPENRPENRGEWRIWDGVRWQPSPNPPPSPYASLRPS